VATNEAGMSLMRKDLQKYVGSATVIGSASASDSWLQAPDFCFGDKRSRNVIDAKGVDNLTWDSGSLSERSLAATNSWREAGFVYVNGRCVYVNAQTSANRSAKNEAGMWLITNDFRIYLGNSLGNATRSRHLKQASQFFGQWDA
jgi:hypothetical protein